MSDMAGTTSADPTTTCCGDRAIESDEVLILDSSTFIREVIIGHLDHLFNGASHSSQYPPVPEFVRMFEDTAYRYCRSQCPQKAPCAINAVAQSQEHRSLLIG